MSMQTHLEQKLRSALLPTHLEIINESHRHAVPAGSASHFKVVVVSEAFADRGLLARHRQVNQVLADELAGQIHALALHTYTPEEWNAKQGVAPQSPPCHGGSKQTKDS